ncbi:MAG: NADP-dependent isocitrate dehydrogenase [Crocinitomicaceae bacterium]
MALDNAPIVCTITDEAPALATQSFLPIVQAFTRSAGINIETKDISLAGRILAAFPDYLTNEQKISDTLSELGELAKQSEANIIKLPNISASVPQLLEAIQELQSKEFNIPDYPEDPESDEEKEIQSRYNKVKGSAVNPVLREGNSDRRAPRAVKNYAKANPHRMDAWSAVSKTHVSTMSSGDFRSNEKSYTMPREGKVSIEFVSKAGEKEVLKTLNLLEGEIIDATYMSVKQLVTFLEEQVADARDKGVLFSIHMKATMMKVSDPIIFGYAVKAYFKAIWEKHGKTLDDLGVEERNGFGDLITKIETAPNKVRFSTHQKYQDREWHLS